MESSSVPIKAGREGLMRRSKRFQLKKGRGKREGKETRTSMDVKSNDAFGSAVTGDGYVYLRTL